MLGFGKKKKKEKDAEKEDKAVKKDLPEPEKKDNGRDETDTGDTTPEKASSKKKKKRFSKKLIFIILLVLIAVGASSYVVYTFYFSSKNAAGKKAVYQPRELKYIHLPEEIRRFSFEYFPDLYSAMIAFDFEMDLFDKEITRIEHIAQKYPDQKKIADKEKKVWKKAKNALQKTFIKIEKPVKEIYVLFQVNKDQGLARIDEKKKELAELALAALAPAKEMTRKLKSNKKIPKGLIKGTLYKLKKKFL